MHMYTRSMTLRVTNVNGHDFGKVFELFLKCFNMLIMIIISLFWAFLFQSFSNVVSNASVTVKYKVIRDKRFAFESFMELRFVNGASLVECLAKCLQNGDRCRSVDFFPLPNDFIQCNLQTRLTTNTAFLLDLSGAAYACKILETYLKNTSYSFYHILSFIDVSTSTSCEDVYSNACSGHDLFEEQPQAAGWYHVCTLGKKVNAHYVSPAVLCSVHCTYSSTF